MPRQSLRIYSNDKHRCLFVVGVDDLLNAAADVVVGESELHVVGGGTGDAGSRGGAHFDQTILGIPDVDPAPVSEQVAVCIVAS